MVEVITESNPLESCLKDAREAVYAYSIAINMTQKRFIAELVEQALTTFLAESSKNDIRKIFEENPESPRLWLTNHPSYYFPKYLEPAKTWAEFLFSVHFTLFEIYTDWFAADKAFEHLLKINFLLEFCPSPFLGRFTNNHYSNGVWIWIFGKLSMIEELRTSIAVEKALNIRILKDWIPLEEDEIWDKDEDDKDHLIFEMPETLEQKIIEWDEELIFQERYGKRFNFMFFKQVKNAFWLGKITEKRYSTWEQKEEKKKLVENEKLMLISIFLSEKGFCKGTPSFDNFFDSLSPKIIIPPRNHQDRFTLLIREQQWEYFEIFEKGQRADRFYDYAWVRANEILLALIKNYEQLDLNSLKTEVRYFSNISTDTNDKLLLGLQLNYSLLLEFINHLENLTTQKRTSKLKFLSQRDSITYDEINRRYSVYDDDTEEEFELSGEDWEDYLDNREKSEELEIKFRIHLSSDYIQLAIIDINYLKKFKERSTSKEELILSSEKDYKKYEIFRGTDTALDYRQAIGDRENSSLEKIVEVSEKYLFELIEVGKTFHPANMKILELDFVLPKLTITLTKLKKWNEVIYWGELYFNLPSNFNYVMNYSNEGSLRKRILRAKKEIIKV